MSAARAISKVKTDMRLTKEQNFALMRKALDEWREKNTEVSFISSLDKARREQWRREYMEILARHGINVAVSLPKGPDEG